jgi:hypothetical protein
MLISSEPKQAGIPVDLRTRILGGAVQPLDQLAGEELIAMREMLARGEAQIVSSASKPYLIAKLN